MEKKNISNLNYFFSNSKIQSNTYYIVNSKKFIILTDNNKSFFYDFDEINQISTLTFFLKDAREQFNFKNNIFKKIIDKTIKIKILIGDIQFSVVEIFLNELKKKNFSFKSFNSNLKFLEYEKIKIDCKKLIFLMGQNGWWAKHHYIAQHIERVKNTHNTGIVSNTTLFNKLSNINKNMPILDYQGFIQFYLNDQIDYTVEIKKLEKKYNFVVWDLIITQRKYSQFLHDRKYSLTNVNELKIFAEIVLTFKILELFFSNQTYLITTHPSSILSMVATFVVKKLKGKLIIIEQLFFPSNSAILIDNINQLYRDVNRDFIKIKNKKFNIKELKKASKYFNSISKDEYKPSWANVNKERFKLSKYFHYQKIFNLIKLLIGKIFGKKQQIPNFFATITDFLTLVIRFNFLKIFNFLYFKKDIIIQNKKIIYFPLHVMPEASISVLAKRYTDQLGLLKKIALQLPSDYIICVKEHPTMLGFRKIDFYNQLNEIPNIYLVNTNLNSVYIINKCHCVLTITGTTGWEAIIRGKPVLYFGDVFYSVLSMAKKIENINKFNNYLEWTNNKFIFSKKELLIFISLIYKTSFNLSYEFFWGITDASTLKKLKNKKNDIKKISNAISKKLL